MIMKLWQKVFLLSLLIVTVTIDFTAFFVIQSNHRQIIQREKQHGVSSHAYTEGELKNIVAYTCLQKNEIVLSEDEINQTINSYLTVDNNNDGNILVFDNNANLILSKKSETSDYISNIVKSVSEENDDSYLVKIENLNSKYYVLTLSNLTLDNSDYKLVTLLDITDSYNIRFTQIRKVGSISILISTCTALLLLFICLYFLSPLTRINAATRKIAQGDYDIRLNEKGSNEFAELSQNMNIMTTAIGENVEKLEKIADDRKIFIANLAHEMKTPLTSIMGFGDILRIKKNVSDKDRRDYASIIVDETKRLKILSGKLMELITIGSTQIDMKVLHLRDVIVEVGNTLTPILINNNIELKCRPLDCDILADPELLKSLIYNITDNAIKASPENSVIVIDCEFEGDDFVKITVIDKGRGMKKKDLKRAIEPFYMADKSRTRKSGGAGLGLALCFEIAKMHGNGLEIQSQQGEGTIVSFTLQIPSKRRHSPKTKEV